MDCATYLVYLAWPEKCFAASAADIRYLRSLVPQNARVMRVTTQAAFVRALPKATHVITWQFEKAWYALAPRLKLVATPAAGRELVSQEAPKGVKLHFGAFHGQFISESVIGFMLAWARGFFAAGKAPVGWPREWLSDKCFTLAGSKAVIVGWGHIGREIARKLAALGVAVTGVTHRPPTDLKASTAALREADWLILALPATESTNNLLDRRLIAKLPRRCVVVNIGRGNAVNEADLIAALRARRLAGAYLDVCKGEPTAVRRAGRQAVIDPRRPNVENLVLMPHSSAFAPQYVRLCFKELKDEGLV